MQRKSVGLQLVFQETMWGYTCSMIVLQLTIDLQIADPSFHRCSSPIANYQTCLKYYFSAVSCYSLILDDSTLASFQIGQQVK
ncbi:hypothetical protein AQUCO_00500281v1 [Aquilegia coerulea]|uniref:Uncharacterized protein n=1 Tax=Aquilegia coerulea TaxID=218851 RepID=A0A2G5ER72_AQUCA|nr:hypothetical protein AQUCO_00500281v1 [Aquilegia coerulea]